MGQNDFYEGSILILDSRHLIRLKSIAMRRHVWFRVLSSLERGLVNFVIKVVNKPRSQVLVEILSRIVVKVKRALMSPVTRFMEIVGRPLAKKISQIALKWGHKEALEWTEDINFIRYLAIISMNNIPGFRLGDILLAER